MKPMQLNGRSRLGEFIRKRRQRLGLSVSEAARRANVARSTWMGAEEGTRRTAEYHYAGIEQALRWAHDSIDGILAGDDPIELDELGDDAPAGDRAIVLQVIAIMQTGYKAETKLQMIQDVLDRDFVPDAAADTAEPDQRLSA